MEQACCAENWVLDPWGGKLICEQASRIFPDDLGSWVVKLLGGCFWVASPGLYNLTWRKPKGFYVQ
jgi:hypothetical protein